MRISKHYSGGLTREQFLFYEIRIVAALMCQGIDRNEIYKRIAQENLFQYPTERMIRSMTNVCFKRIDALASYELTHHLADASAVVARQINLYAIMCENIIVYDFMTDVIGEKLRRSKWIIRIRIFTIILTHYRNAILDQQTGQKALVQNFVRSLQSFLLNASILKMRVHRC